jgi:hypothetical protein
LKENGNHTEVIFGIREVEEYSELVRLAEANNKYYLIVNIYKNTNGTYKIYVDINELLGSKFSRKRCMELLFRLGDEKAELLTDIESNYLPLYAPE